MPCLSIAKPSLHLRLNRHRHTHPQHQPSAAGLPSRQCRHATCSPKSAGVAGHRHDTGCALLTEDNPTRMHKVWYRPQSHALPGRPAIRHRRSQSGTRSAFRSGSWAGAPPAEFVSCCCCALLPDPSLIWRWPCCLPACNAPIVCLSLLLKVRVNAKLCPMVIL